MNTLSRHFRSLFRFTCLAGVVVISVAEYVCIARHRRDAVARARWLQSVCQRVLRVFSVEVITTGVPLPGAMLISNHLGYLDILVLAAQLPVVFISKSEVGRWLVFGWFAQRAGTRFINRTVKGDVVRIGEELVPLIDAGLSVVAFLEGTTSDGRDVLPFKTSLLEPAVRYQWRLVPASIDYDLPAGRSTSMEVCWWGDMTLLPHLWNMASLPWIKTRLRWGGAFEAGQDRKVLGERLRIAVKDLRVPQPITVSK